MCILKMEYIEHGNSRLGSPQCYYRVYSWVFPEVTYRVNFALTGAYIQQVDIPKGEDVNAFTMQCVMEMIDEFYYSTIREEVEWPT